MILLGKVKEMKEAKIKAFEKGFERRYPDEDPEVIRQMAEKKYDKEHKRFVEKMKVAFLASVVTLGLTLGVQGFINNTFAKDAPQIGIEVLTDDQRALINSLDGQKLEDYIQAYSVSAHPETLSSYTDNPKAKELAEHSEEYLKDFKTFQDGLLPFIQAYNFHPEKFTEEQMLKALDASNDLLARYVKNEVCAELYSFNANNTNTELRLYSLPDPNKVNFFRNHDGERECLAETEYVSGGLVNKGVVYTENNYKRNGFDYAIDNFIGNQVYLETQRDKLEEGASKQSHIQKTIDRILNNNNIADKVAHTNLIVEKHWFNSSPTYDFEFEDGYNSKTKYYEYENGETSNSLEKSKDSSEQEL